MALPHTLEITLTVEPHEVNLAYRTRHLSNKVTFFGQNGPYCYSYSTLSPHPVLVHRDGRQHAYYYMEKLLRDKPNRYKVIISIFHDNTITPNVFFRPRQGISSIRISGITDVNILGRVLSELSADPIETLIIDVPEGTMLRGLAEIPLVRTTQSLIVTGNCDISDEDLASFVCDDINIHSPFLTEEGVKRHIEKVHRMDLDDLEDYNWRILAGFPVDTPSREIDILPIGFRPTSCIIQTNRDHIQRDPDYDSEDEDQDYELEDLPVPRTPSPPPSPPPRSPPRGAGF